MSSQHGDLKKRPPPINIPPLPVPLPRPIPPPTSSVSRPNRAGQQQREVARNASNSTQQGPRSAGSTPLTSPLEQERSRILQSGSSKSRTSHMTNLTNFMDQAHYSPRKSEHGSTRGSTTRSRHSGKSQHSAVTAQAHLEAVDEKTNRGQIESRSERNLFKLTGQVPPTPTMGPINEDDVYIRTEDLRAQCRAVGEEKHSDRDESVKSPKKKMFAGLNNLFGRSTSTVPMPTPPMPSKAAQVFGTSARKSHKIEPRPIKPAGPFKTPTKAPRSDTSKSLPSKVRGPNSYSRRHRSGSMRRNRPGGRRSPGKGSRQSSDAENTPPAPQLNHSFESVPPPTPPAKDTPPDHRASMLPQSPLRRTAPSHDLRESFEGYVDGGMKLRLPEFAQSPLPSQAAVPDTEESDPTKYRPYTAEDYTKLIGGQALQWPYPDTDADVARDQREGKRSAPLATGTLEAFPLPRPGRWSEEYEYSKRNSHRLSPLPPRFYSPSNRSVRLFAEGETPSKNSDCNRMLFTLPSQPKVAHRRDDSSNGTIEMVFQGSASEIDPNSSTGQLINNTNLNATPLRTHDDNGVTARVMQELRIIEPQEPAVHGTPGHLQPDQSSSRLTDILNGVSPHRPDFNGDFRPKCPSAVPSPLHKVPVPLVLTQVPTRQGALGPWVQPHTPKTFEDHFFMTNEHLDVVGKTTWDLLEMFKQQQLSAISTKHERLVGLLEKHVEEVKSQVNIVNEKADRAADNQHNIQTSLNALSDFIKADVMKAVEEQNKKAVNLEAQIKELVKVVQVMQKLLEQRLPEPKTSQQHSATVLVSATSAAPPSYPHPVYRSQPSLAGYYGAAVEAGREAPPPVPHMHDNRSVGSPQDGHNDTRAGYSNGYRQQWATPHGTPQGFPARNNKEDRTSYSGTNPYHFANGGQFNNGYTGGYSSYNYSPSSPEQHYAFTPGQAK